MEKELTQEEIRDRLAGLYRDAYDSWHLLKDEATAALHDGDEGAYKAITRRADKRQDYMDGLKDAAEALGIEDDELMTAVNADRAEGE